MSGRQRIHAPKGPRRFFTETLTQHNHSPVTGRTPQGDRVGRAKVWTTLLHTADPMATREATRIVKSLHRKGCALRKELLGVPT